MSVPFRPLGNRVVIKADRDDRAPVATDSGLVLAQTLAAAVEGSDSEDSWFVGTVVEIGPLVNRFELRPWLARRLQELANRQVESYEDTLESLGWALERLPAECPDPIRVGDRVTFSWASGQEITVDGEKFLIMAASEVLAVLEPEYV